MKKFLKVILPIILALIIILGILWYLFVYDRAFTRDMLLHGARYFEAEGDMDAASWFYDRAYEQGSGSDEIAIELARQYIAGGNYTQAEVTLNKAIKDGAGVSVYIALSKTYIEQDKLLDAVDLLDKLSDPKIKAELEKLRPAAPTTQQAPGFYNQYISVSVESDGNALYVSGNGQYPSVMTDAYVGPISLQDGENVIYALAVSDTGLVSPISIFGYTVGGVIEEVSFADPAIETLIRQALQVTESKVLYSNDLWGIREFTVPAEATNYSDLRHLAFLETLTIDKGVSGQLDFLPKLTTLKSLTIRETTVSTDELQLIGSITSLERLTLSNCMLSTTTGLEGLKNLTYLDLSTNAIRNISALSGMTQLRELYIGQNALQDLSAISGCMSLSKLDVSYNAITSINPLYNLVLLNYLNISHNAVTDITGINALAELNTLYMNNNQIMALDPLSDCKKLSHLNVAHNSIVSIEPLSGINSLTNLDFSYNSVTKLPKWSSACALVNIDGSYNQITDLSNLAVLKAVNNIFMDYNENIKSIEELAVCPVLIQVNVYGTKVTEVKALTDQSIIVNYNPVQ